MKLKRLTTAVLLSATGFIQLAVARPSLSQPQTDLNAQLKQALCTQNWGQALQILDRLKRAAGPQYASQITIYRGRIEALARQNVKMPNATDGCSSPSPAAPAPANNNIAPAPSNPIPTVPSNDIPTAPSNDVLPVPSIPTL